MDRYVLDLEEVDRSQVALVGGKGASLGELSRIEGVSVPGGFCVSTEAFRRARAEPSGIDAIPDEIVASITEAISRRGGEVAFAVRSSATDEDQSGTSFAGQYESYLDVTGTESVLEHLKLCWRSLSTERALAYRQENAVDDRDPAMAVVVQEMVHPEAAGVLFTADPVTSNRKITSVEAVPGLGESLVSGTMNPDTYEVRGDEINAQTHESPVLSEQQVMELARLGRRIETHFGSPQDTEWCLADGRFRFVQSRPITTLFPVPVADDGANHVYVSVGHQQMMTDAMKPLGLSFWQMTTPRPMCEAGNRLFVDVAATLATAAGRDTILVALDRSDPLIGDALHSLIDRGFIPSLPEEEPGATPATPRPDLDPPKPLLADPDIAAELIERSEESIEELKRAIVARSGVELTEFISADIEEGLKPNLFSPESQRVITATMEATWWLNEKLEEWLGEKGAADVLTQSVTGNVSAEMGLALLDVADSIRPYPEVVAFLEAAPGHHFLDRLDDLEGGPEARDAIRSFLDRHGMRCVGEIDITRPRWSEDPAALLPMIIQNVRNAEPGAARRKFERGVTAAREKERELRERLRELPDGERKAAETSRNIELVRTFTGYREYPKYGMVSRFFVYKQALLKEAARLEREDLIADREDIFYLRFEELEESLRRNEIDHELIARRKREYRRNVALTPPRVMTSEGEVLAGTYGREGLPDGALAGLAVSAGIAEGRARVIRDPAQADLRPGDILVTTFTDPSWAPVFVGIEALLTEVGGLMTHGAVVAREYGLPAVVGVDGATRLIRDGQAIRVHGTDGYVEILN